MRKSCAITSIASVVVGVVWAVVPLVLGQDDRTGSISVECDRTGAQVYLDGTSCGRTPKVISGVSAGNHELVVLASDTEAFLKTVSVRSGETSEITVRMSPLSGRVSVSTDPPGAAVSVDGSKIGFSPLDAVKLAQGKHLITAEMEGFTSREKEIVLEYGEEISVFLPLSKKETVFSVYSFPTGADVYLDGKNVGKTPLELADVRPGQYSLRVALNENCIHEESITVEAGRDVVLDITLPTPGALLVLDPGPAGRELHIDGRHFGEVKESRMSVPPGDCVLRVTGWKKSLLYQRHMKLEEGKTCELDVQPKFKLAASLKGHEQALLGLEFVADSNLLVSTSKDGRVRVWDISKQDDILSIDARAQALAVSSDGKQLATGGWDGVVRVWSLPAGRELRKFETKSPVNALAWSPDDSCMTAGCMNGEMVVWSTGENWGETRLRAHTDGIRSLAFDLTGRILATGGADARVILWKTSDWSEAARLIEESPVKEIVFTRDGSRLATGCEDGSVRIRALSDLETVRPVKAQPHWILSLSAGWGSVVAAGGDSEEITVLDCSKGILLRLSEPDSPATALAFDRTGRYLAAGSSNGLIYLWLIE